MKILWNGKKTLNKIQDIRHDDVCSFKNKNFSSYFWEIIFPLTWDFHQKKITVHLFSLEPHSLLLLIGKWQQNVLMTLCLDIMSYPWVIWKSTIVALWWKSGKESSLCQWTQSQFSKINKVQALTRKVFLLPSFPTLS
jgi:hypothetical protein